MTPGGFPATPLCWGLGLAAQAFQPPTQGEAPRRDFLQPRPGLNGGFYNLRAASTPSANEGPPRAVCLGMAASGLAARKDSGSSDPSRRGEFTGVPGG